MRLKLKKGVLHLLAILFLLPLCLFCMIPVLAGTEGNYYQVQVQVNDATFGKVSVSGGTQDAAKNYLYESVLTLTPIPEPGYRFNRWVMPGGTYRYDTVITHNVVDDCTIRADFSAKKYTVQYNDGGSGLTYSEERLTEYVYGTDYILPTPGVPEGYHFLHWEVKSGSFTAELSAGQRLTQYDYPGTITLTPKLEANDETVKRIDEAKDGTFLGESEFSAKYGTSVSGKDGEDRFYRGYWFLDASENYTILSKVTESSLSNQVKRFYLQRKYSVFYQNVGAGFSGPATHTFGNPTGIPNPSKEGYTFLGWTLSGVGNTDWKSGTELTVGKDYTLPGDIYDSADWNSDPTQDASGIVLTARWQANSYSVQYENTDSSDGLPTTRDYDKVFTLPNNLTRAGYEFLGWRIFGSSDVFVKDYQLSTPTTEDGITFEAGWENAAYEVNLDSSNGSQAVTPGDLKTTVTFDVTLPNITIPVCRGYRFLGYYSQSDEQYYDQDGKGMPGKKWETAGGATLYARWEICSYQFSIDPAFLQHISQITVNGTPYTAPVLMQYKTQISVVVTMQNGYQLTAWNGTAVTHRKNGTFTLTQGDDNFVLTGTILPMMPVPQAFIDYSSETMRGQNGVLPAGQYLLTIDNSEKVEFSVTDNGILRFADGSTCAFYSISQLFGKNLLLYRCGDGILSSDSDPQSFTLGVRLEAPTFPGDILQLIVRENDVAFTLQPSSPVSYQFAYALAGTVVDEDTLQWQNEPVFANLRPGTPYLFYVRVAAGASYPHGKTLTVARTTGASAFLQNQAQRIRGLWRNGDGENAKLLLQQAEEKMNNQIPGQGFYDRVEALYSETVEKLTFARIKDAAFAGLESKAQALIASGRFSQSIGIAELNSCVLLAKQNLEKAQDSAAVIAICDLWSARMDSVPVNVLTSGKDITVESSTGMSQTAQLFLSRVQNSLFSVEEEIGKSVRLKKVNLGQGDIFIRDSAKTLERMNVVAFYRMQFEGSQSGSNSGKFYVRLYLPEDLRNAEIASVAMYSQDGVLTLVDFSREGDYVQFTTDTISDFAFFTEGEFDVSKIVIMLMVVILVQLIAICWILISRNKRTHTSAAIFPVTLFAGVTKALNSVPLCLGLLAVVLVLQAILLCLVLSGDKKSNFNHSNNK